MTPAFGARLARLREVLTQEHLDALVVSALPNARYLTGFSGSNALVLVTPRTLHLLTDFRYEAQVAQECPDSVVPRIERASLWTGLWSVLTESGVKTIGFESAHLTHRDFQRLLEQGTAWHWRATTDLVERLRAVKEAEEVACIAAAGEVATRALQALLPGLHAGQTELEICGALERHLREQGSEGHPFPPIVASGPRSALPHARASQRAIAHGDLLLLDFGAIVDGYCSDITRTVAVGRADPRQLEVHAAVVRASDAAMRGIRAGLLGREADALARDSLTAEGFGEAFGHSLGHGLGLEVHEAPRLSKLAEDSLPEGAVVTIEPGVYLADWGGVRLEDDVRVSAAGVDLLTHFSRELLIVDV